MSYSVTIAIRARGSVPHTTYARSGDPHTEVGRGRAAASFSLCSANVALLGWLVVSMASASFAPSSWSPGAYGKTRTTLGGDDLHVMPADVRRNGGRSSSDLTPVCGRDGGLADDAPLLDPMHIA